MTQTNSRYGFLFVLFLLPFFALAEDGSKLWLRFPNAKNGISAQKITAKGNSKTLGIAKKELTLFWQGQSIELRIDKSLSKLKDGYTIKSNASKITISSAKETGLLYGVYHILRLQETKENLTNLNISEKPSYDIRILNHWDNLDRTVERGYAGYSLWKWDELPNTISPRYEEYARANASIGINAVVLNNVNASPNILKTEYLQKVKVLADIFRPYGIKV